jgi:hypothetical protein
LKYNGGLYCSLLHNDNPSFEEKYSPGTQVERIDPSINMLLAGTFMDIPFSLDPSGDNSVPLYTILFDNGMMVSIPLSNMAGIIPLPPINVADSDSRNSLLPPFLCLNSKITFEHEGQYAFWDKGIVSTFLFTNLMLTNVGRIGACPCQIFHPNGLICESKVSFFLVMSPT